MYASPWRFKILKGPMNRCCNFVLCVFDNACVGRLLVESNTRSLSLKTSLCFLPFLSAFSFCLSTASAMASRTKRRIICRFKTKSSIASLSRFDILLMSLRASKFASTVALSDTAFDLEVERVDEGRESVVSPTLKVDSPLRSEGRRGCLA